MLSVLFFALLNMAKSQEIKLETYSKFDFIAGEKVLFYEDFSVENVGDFPVRWNTNGSGEIITMNNFPGKWLQLKKGGAYYPETNEFPDNFTVEFDMIGHSNNPEDDNVEFGCYIVSGNNKDINEGGAIPGVSGTKMAFTNTSFNFSSYTDGGYTVDGSSETTFEKDKKYHVSIWVQKSRLRLYLNENKLLDVPRALDTKFKYNIVRFENYIEFSAHVGKSQNCNRIARHAQQTDYGWQTGFVWNLLRQWQRHRKSRILWNHEGNCAGFERQPNRKSKNSRSHGHGWRTSCKSGSFETQSRQH